MIPKSTLSNTDIVYKKQPSNTYSIREDSTIRGYIDGIDAVKQAVNLILSTERYAYPIYSWNYGVELESLIGQEYGYIIPEVKRRIKEALIQDERIRDVIDFRIEKQEDEMTIEFEVVSCYGNFGVSRMVNI